MDLRQLSYFVAVAEEGQFTRAAARVLVAQPAISAQIRGLERELGETLFHRDPRAVRLTEAGAALLPHARAALAAAERGLDTIASLRGLLHGRLRIGVAGPVDRRLTETLGDSDRPHPARESEHTTQHKELWRGALASGAAGAGVTGRGPHPPPPQIRARVVSVEPLVLAVARGNPLSRRKTITLDALR